MTLIFVDVWNKNMRIYIYNIIFICFCKNEVASVSFVVKCNNLKLSWQSDHWSFLGDHPDQRFFGTDIHPLAYRTRMCEALFGRTRLPVIRSLFGVVFRGGLRVAPVLMLLFLPWNLGF